jgi:CRP-like cAMP-binding protein
MAIRELAARTLAARDGHTAGARPPATPVASPLGLVERMIVLRHQELFGRSAPLEAIALLAHASRETTWPAGATMIRPDEPARDACFLLEGRVRVVRDGVPDEHAARALGPGAALGLIEGLAGVPHAATIEVVAPVRALQIASSVVFDVVEDHTDLGLSIVEALAAGLLDAVSVPQWIAC